MSGPEVLKLEFETVLKFYNLKARSGSKFISFELLVPGYAKH